MRVLGVLAAWGVLAVLATMCFALGASLGYRRGVRDTLAQLRDRRTGAAGCRPLPANHLRRRTSGHARPGARARRARWRPRHAGAPVAGPTRAVLPARSNPRVAVLAASVAAVLLVGVPGAAVGATTAQPGESLYTVRRGLEDVRVALARGEDGTEVHVELAAARLTDLQGLVGDADVKPEVIADVSSDLGSHATAASRRLKVVEDDTHRSALGQKLRDVVGKQVEVIDDIVNGDCADDVEGDCAALNETREHTVTLQADTERDVAVAEGSPAPPTRTVTQAEQGDRITAEVVDDGAAVDGAAATEEAEQTGPDAPTAATASAPASAPSAVTRSSAPNDSASKAAPKSRASPKPAPPATPSTGSTASASPSPPASAAGSPATEPEDPADRRSGDSSEAGGAGTGQ